MQNPPNTLEYYTIDSFFLSDAKYINENRNISSLTIYILHIKIVRVE